jgi:hypothetical protein
MEILGIPLFIIFLIVIRALSEYSDQQQKEKEQIANRWDAIAPGMTKREVLRRLGKPNRLVQVGAQEAWGYGPNSSDGEIFFVDEQVVGFQKPSSTVNISVP